MYAEFPTRSTAFLSQGEVEPDQKETDKEKILSQLTQYVSKAAGLVGTGYRTPLLPETTERQLQRSPYPLNVADIDTARRQRDINFERQEDKQQTKQERHKEIEEQTKLQMQKSYEMIANFCR